MHTNRLINSTSPYLLQHAHNPVDWQPWDAQALEQAKREQKPIFLSIGYSACHWCHVMEHEVFEKEDIAAIMNAHFINIKVDREERPDLDDLYMMATQIMSGSGGWPMSVWLTPDLEPFYAGTYFPPVDGYGRPGFPRLELALADAWKNRRPELITQAQRAVEAIRMHADESAKGTAEVAGEIHARQWIETAAEQQADRFDETYGGLGGAPKFPPHQALQFWLGILQHPEIAPDTDPEAVRIMLTRTLVGMMTGGIYDHIGGAFARYSTDERWLVPHFEKMLYDSAQLVPVYVLASVIVEDEPSRREYARIAQDTLDFFLREMVSPLGAFYSSLDADSEGAEGKFYVWTIEDVEAALDGNENDVALIIAHLGLRSEGNWHESPVEGASVLAVAASAELIAAKTGIAPADLRHKLDTLLVKMRAYRAQRPPPGLDDKILTSWNGLMISALAIAGRILHEPRYLEAAHRAIGFLLTHHMAEGKRLLRVSRNGQAHTDAFLDDHAYLLNGLMELIDSTSPTSLPGTMARRRALELADTLIRDFEDPAHGGFFYTSQRHEKLFARMKNAADNATPSANGVAIRALFRLAQESGNEKYRQVAMRAVQAFATNIARRPEYFPTILHALLEDAAAAKAISPSAAGLAPLAHNHQDEPSLLTLSLTPPSPTAPGTTLQLRVHLTIAEGYHIESHDPANREAYRTIIRLRGDLDLHPQWHYPPDQPLPGNIAGYQGKIEFLADCQIPATSTPGLHKLHITVLAQPCTQSACYPPERAMIEFPIEIISSSSMSL